MTPDFIVVGAGTAGCVLARDLSARGIRVALIEAGPSHRHMHVQIPAAFPKLFKTGRDWGYSTSPQAALNDRKVFWPRGRMLGGSSSMNAQIHQWPSRSDCERWVEEGARGWGWQEMLPALKQVDAELNGGRLRDPNPLTNAFVEAAASVGLSTGESYNGDILRPCASISEVAHRNGARWSAADAYLVKSPHLEVITRATVERVLFNDGRAAGVALRRQGRSEVMNASRGIILAAGAINSPHLLMVSGIGPARRLQAHGVPVVCDSPNVGNNLQDHLMLVMHYRARRPITLRSAESPANLWRYLTARRGMLASNVAEAVAFFASQPDQPVDMEIVFAPVLFEKEGLKPPSGHGFSLAPVLLAPKSRGAITLAGPQSTTPPVIDPAYLSDPAGHDLERLTKGVRFANRLASQAPLKEETTGIVTPVDMSGEAIHAAIRSNAHTIYHPVGTCRMGEDSASVVACDLKVRGVDGLWVADASVMPSITSGHPNASLAAIAHLAANLIAA